MNRDRTAALCNTLTSLVEPPIVRTWRRWRRRNWTSSDWRTHLIRRADELGRPDLIPTEWRSE